MRSSLDYCGPQGSHTLRCVLANDLLRKRGIDCTASDVVITCGALHAIALLSMVLRQRAQRPTVGVEMPGYWGFRKTLRMLGIQVLSLPVDSRGARPDPSIVAQCDAIILTPRHQFPTNVTLSLQRRSEFLALADCGRCLVVEDDYSCGFDYLGEPPQPLLGGGLRRNGVYIGSFSKVFAPGLRMGCLVGSPDVVEAVTDARWRIDRHSPEILQLLLATMIRSGVYDAALSRTVRFCQKRWQAMNVALASCFGLRPRSAGGLSIWLSTGASWRDLRAVVRHADLLGVKVDTGAECYDAMPRHGALRIGYTCAGPNEIAVGVSRLAGSFRHVTGRMPSCRNIVAPPLRSMHTAGGSAADGCGDSGL
jgi:GntR family transcriptional regulator/MocR family aminotransferase